MGNSARYEVWRIERKEEGVGWRWAIWDNQESKVAMSGESQSVDEAVLKTKFWVGFLMDVDRTMRGQRSSQTVG
jgi:hypothetical protein